uniref:BTB/POZ domain-containing protein KCTD9 n=1 Tax=Leptobrachium leishanense TaxID=445787 RepID=A0A8C5PJ54_9ANUR
MKRVTLFVKGSPRQGKVVPVNGSLPDLLSLASTKFGIHATSLYNERGGHLEDIDLIRDDDVLFVCGEELPMHTEQMAGSHTDWLTLNVGGHYFTTARSTLVSKEPDSMLSHMFRDRDAWGNKRDHKGAFLIDRSPEYFEPILNYLRHGQLIVNDGVNLLGVLEEAKFFNIISLIEHLELAIKNSLPADDHSPISRKEFIRFLLATPTKSELRCQGANLQGVKMLCSNAEGASLIGCNFEDPSGLKANLEGANLKGVDMEGSQMTGINLRVATLKNAKLKNCNLRGATLAGTDLENCDLSGCDLQEANLRGSNVKGAIFEEMLTPLHMSQSVR